MRAFAFAITLLLSMQSAFAQAERREVTIENACQQPIRILLLLADRHNDYRTYGWYTIQPGRGPTTLNDGGVRLGSLTNHGIFYYAEGVNFRQVWEGTDTYRTFNGIRYGMRRASPTMQQGRLAVRLC